MAIVMLRWKEHRQRRSKRKHIQIHVSHELPGPAQYGQRDALRLQGSRLVVTEEIGIAEDVSGTGVVIGEPES